MAKVPFNSETIKKCICPQCSIQTDSQCVKGKMAKVIGIKNGIKEDTMPRPEEIPGMYCATGIAFCQDIDTTKACICETCPLWEEYSLSDKKPLGFYCRDGKIEEKIE